jgi:Zn-dependent protease with chaperone function
VLITDRAAFNAAVIGSDEAHATIIVPTALLANLSRDEMQGVAAHLIASIADGDMTIGMRASLTRALFGTIARFSTLLSDDDGWGKLKDMAVAFVRPTKRTVQKLAVSLGDPFAPEESEAVAQPARPKAKHGDSDKFPWRLLLWMPFAGPVVFTGFLGGLVSTMMLSPLLAVGWRQRKYMADATAVRLTRDPDCLAKALQKMGGGAAFAAWAAHLSVADGGSAGSWFGNTIVPMIPGTPRRLRALQKLGASVTPVDPRRIPWHLMLIIAPLFAVVGVLLCVVVVLLAYVSIPISMLMTGIPFAVIHLLLRWLGH